MARQSQQIRTPPQRLRLLALALLAVLVLQAHDALLGWAKAWQLAQQPRPLHALARPLLTRQITVQTPPPLAPMAAPKVPEKTTPNRLIALTKPAQIAIDTVAPVQPSSAASTAAPASAPDLTPEPAAAATAAAGASAAALASSPVAVAPSNPEVTSTLGIGPNFSAAWPLDTRLTYVLTGNFRGPLSGSAEVEWQRELRDYQVRVDIEIGFLAKVSMVSQGELSPEGLQPRVYEETTPRKRRSLNLGPSRITFEGGGVADRPAGVQDTASQFVSLSQQFASGQSPLAVGSFVNLWLARPGELILWTYDVVEEETLYTRNFGPVQAFHLVPRPVQNPRGNITAEMWFAPTLQYLPVRIRISLAQEQYLDLLVDKIEQRDNVLKR
jgi:Protein of unknown function (DUF3108)